MSNGDVARAKRFFRTTWNDKCAKPLTPQARHELHFLFQKTLRAAIEEGATWDDAAVSYVGPILEELATNVCATSGATVTDDIIEHGTKTIIEKYRPSSGSRLWCAFYELPPDKPCDDLSAAERLFFGTFRAHCDNLDASGESQLYFIFKRTLEHAVCAKGVKLNEVNIRYLQPKIVDFAQTARGKGSSVGHALLHEAVVEIIKKYQRRVKRKFFLAWCVDYPQGDLDDLE